MIRCTLVAGLSTARREATIARLIDPTVPTAVILEGPPADRWPPPALADFPFLTLVGIAPSCPGCDGGLVMRVTLDRMLRRRPTALFIGLADTGHPAHLLAFLDAPPYKNLLTVDTCEADAA